jgi:hypothetical protein
MNWNVGVAAYQDTTLNLPEGAEENHKTSQIRKAGVLV